MADLKPEPSVREEEGASPGSQAAPALHPWADVGWGVSDLLVSCIHVYHIAKTVCVRAPVCLFSEADRILKDN